jgi:DNA-binding transcriptional LysR family regulator
VRRLDNIDLRLLRVYVALVEAGGFAGAQVVLNLSQSTLSTHLSDLEKRIGGPLCIRGRKTFRLTDLGRVTLDAARKLFADIEEFGHRIGTASGRLTGRLRIGIVDGVFTSPALGLQATLAGLLEPDYDVFIDLVQATPQELEQAVADGRRDVVIGPFAQKAPGVVYREAHREPHHLYCGSGHDFFDRPDDTISRADIEATRLSVRGYRQLDDLFRIGHPKAAASVLNMEAQAMLILSGRYVGFLPCHYAEPHIAAGRMRAVQPSRYGFSSQHHVAYRRSDADRPLIGAFVAAFLARARAADQAGVTDPDTPAVERREDPQSGTQRSGL